MPQSTDPESDLMTDTALTPTGSKPSGFLGALQATFGPALWRAYIYGLVTAVLGMVVSIAVFVLTVTGASLIIVWIGLPIVLAALLVARAALNVDLVLQRRLLSADVQPVTLDLSGLTVLPSSDCFTTVYVRVTQASSIHACNTTCCAGFACG